VKWITLAHNGDKWQAVVNTVMSIWVPYTAENFLSWCSTVSFSRKAVVCGVCWFVYLVGWFSSLLCTAIWRGRVWERTGNERHAAESMEGWIRI
jgi:hypothetical protein